MLLVSIKMYITEMVKRPQNSPDLQLKLNSVAFLVRKRTILTERPPYVGEVSTNFWG
jgi:hypothetical protein